MLSLFLAHPARLGLAAFAFALTALGASTPAAAQDYPNKPVRLIVGPGPDTLARIIGEKLSAAWGQPVVVDQRAAAGGVVAGDAVAKAPADGYTLLLSTGSYTINSALRAKSPYDFQRDLVPVSLLATLPFVLVVTPSLPAQNLHELVTLAQARPGKLNFASSGNGTPSHLAGEMLKLMAKIDMVHVAYKGAAPAVTDVVGGQVQMSFLPAPSALPLIKTGKLRALAVSGPQRYAALPDVPTVAEQGYPQFSVVGWNGIHAPARTPAAVIARLSRDIAAALKLPDAQQRAVAAGFEPMGTTREEFEAFVQADIARAITVIRAAHIEPE